jgi:hypothetical protein
MAPARTTERLAPHRGITEEAATGLTAGRWVGEVQTSLA